MPAYMLVDLNVHDAAGFQDYRNRVPALIAKHGGEYLVRGGDFEVIEGDWTPHRLVMFRFPNRAAIRAFFDDPDYAELLALRKRTSTSVVVAMDGVA
jgi:uncharacterized protein (DUF1330 family)